MDISPIDTAWEAVTVLRDLSTKALEELQRRGGNVIRITAFCPVRRATGPHSERVKASTQEKPRFPE
jgi:hypothetical protein